MLLIVAILRLFWGMKVDVTDHCFPQDTLRLGSTTGFVGEWDVEMIDWMERIFSNRREMPHL